MNLVRWRSHRLRNLAQSALVLLAMAGLLGLLGWLVAGELGVVLAGAGVLLIGGFTPALSPRLTLQLAGARRLAPSAAPELYETVHALAARAGLERVPTLHYVPSSAVNAFAVGDGHASAIAVTDGILRVLTRRELTGVLAHELSHLRSGDTWLLNLSAVFTRLTHTLSLAGQLLLVLNIPLLILGEVSFGWSAIVVLILAPTLSALLHLALSRTREFDADLGAVELTHDPAGLASALEKLSRIERRWFQRMFRLGPPGDSGLLRTHPATPERIRRLHELQAASPMATQGWTSRGDHPGPGATFLRPDPELYRPRRRRLFMQRYR